MLVGVMYQPEAQSKNKTGRDVHERVDERTEDVNYQQFAVLLSGLPLYSDFLWSAAVTCIS